MYIQPVGSNNWKWPVILVLILFGGAVLLGLTLTNTDLFNGNLTSAKKLEIETRTANNSAKAQEELRRQKALTEEELRHQQAIKAIEEAQRSRDLQRDSELRALAVYVGLAVSILAALILAGGAVYWIYSRQQIRLSEVEASVLAEKRHLTQMILAAPLTAEGRDELLQSLHVVHGDGRNGQGVVP